MNEVKEEYKDLYDQSGRITLNDIIVILCTLLLAATILSLCIGFRDEIRIVAKRCALCCGLNNRCRQYRLRLQMAWALVRGEDLEVARIKQAALAESESRKRTKRIDYEIYNPHTERVVDPQLPDFMLKEQKLKAQQSEEEAKIHKRGTSEHASSVAETIATHRRLISANTEKCPKSGRGLQSITDEEEDVGYEDDEEEEEEYDDEEINSPKKHSQQPTKIPNEIFGKDHNQVEIKPQTNPSENQNVIIRKQLNKQEKINQRKTKIQKLLEMQQMNLGIEDEEKLKELQREQGVVMLEVQKSEKSKVYNHPLAKNKMQKGFLNFNSFQKSLVENNMDVDSADKVKAFAPPTISQVFSHISKNNSDFMVPEDFKLASYHKDFSIRDKNYSNLLEVVETPRGDTIIDAKFFYNEENFFKYDEVTNAKKGAKPDDKKKKREALPPLDKKRKAKSTERKVKKARDIEKL